MLVILAGIQFSAAHWSQILDGLVSFKNISCQTQCLANCSFTACHLPGHFGFIGCHLWPFAHTILHFGCSLVRNLDGHIGQDLAALVLLPAFSGGNAHKCWAEDQVV